MFAHILRPPQARVVPGSLRGPTPFLLRLCSSRTNSIDSFRSLVNEQCQGALRPDGERYWRTWMLRCSGNMPTAQQPGGPHLYTGESHDVKTGSGSVTNGLSAGRPSVDPGGLATIKELFRVFSRKIQGSIVGPASSGCGAGAVAYCLPLPAPLRSNSALYCWALCAGAG